MLHPILIKEIRQKIHTSYGDSDKLPPIKPLLIIILVLCILYILLKYIL